MTFLPGDSAQLRKARGAFFTPMAVAEHLADWAIGGNPSATVLDPTCGEAVFLLAAGEKLSELGRSGADLEEQLFGVDLHAASLDEATRLLEERGMDAHLVESDFFAVPTPDMLDAPLPYVDAVIGNPPFIRYQEHVGSSRRMSAEAALRQGVRLSGLASSWAASLAHASGFLKPEGRLAMVLPAELLTVGYAEPVRAWLRSRFERVNLVLFEKLVFADALADVVLLLAEGRGGCDSFSLWHVETAEDLATIRPYAQTNVTPPASGKWTDILIPKGQRGLYRDTLAKHFVGLGDYGAPTLGTVTGANGFFALNEETRLRYGLAEDQVVRISPPGTRHLRGTTFSTAHWRALRDAGERVWLFHPDADDTTQARRAYTTAGEAAGVNRAYKCSIRSPWWRPPAVQAPDLFFTYMSHHYPRLVTNSARATFLNSMHGVRLRQDAPPEAATALPLLALNSVTMLGAEVNGRSYGGGILKMEPREAALLPVPTPELLVRAWADLRPERAVLERQLQAGRWTDVAKRVDQAVLVAGAGLSEHDVAQLLLAARALRERRARRGGGH